MRNWGYTLVGACVLGFVICLAVIAIWASSRPAPGLAKGDLLPISGPLVSHPVKTVILAAADAEPILEPPIENKVPETDKGELEDKPAVTFHHEDAPRVPRAILSDICARSGGIKRFTSHGRRWHCEYSRR